MSDTPPPWSTARAEAAARDDAVREANYQRWEQVKADVQQGLERIAQEREHSARRYAEVKNLYRRCFVLVGISAVLLTFTTYNLVEHIGCRAP